MFCESCSERAVERAEVIMLQLPCISRFSYGISLLSFVVMSLSILNTSRFGVEST